MSNEGNQVYWADVIKALDPSRVCEPGLEDIVVVSTSGETVTLEGIVAAIKALAQFDPVEMFDMMSSGAFEEAFPFTLTHRLGEDDIDLGSFSDLLQSDQDLLRDPEDGS